MIGPYDYLIFQQGSYDARTAYRDVYLVYPSVTTGSNWDEFSSGPDDITGARSGQYSVTYTTYRAQARIKIIMDTTLLPIAAPVPGLDIGDYLLYFTLQDRAAVQSVIDNKYGYMFVDGVVLRPSNVSLNGVGLAYDVYCHAKKYDAEFRATGY